MFPFLLLSDVFFAMPKSAADNRNKYANDDADVIVSKYRFVHHTVMRHTHAVIRDKLCGKWMYDKQQQQQQKLCYQISRNISVLRFFFFLFSTKSQFANCWVTIIVVQPNKSCGMRKEMLSTDEKKLVVTKIFSFVLLRNKKNVFYNFVLCFTVGCSVVANTTTMRIHYDDYSGFTCDLNRNRINEYK